jgi:hypothetical protein
MPYGAASGQPDGISEPSSWERVHAEFSDWSPADRRILWITIGGGLIVNLATVLIIGAAVVVARAEHTRIGRDAATIAAVAFSFGATVLSLWIGRNLRMPGKSISVPLVAWAAGLFLLAAVLILGLIGRAAGVK